jgi:CRISPR-associated exonuclease Cas4
MKPYSLPVHLLRQHAFCPRIPYFIEGLGITPETPLWVKQGEDYHERQERLTRDRTLRRFSLDHATRQFRVRLSSTRLSIHGIADAVLETVTEVYPVEFKTELSVAGRGQILQLMAYGMMAEEMQRKHFAAGFLLYGQKGKTRRIERTDALSSDAERVLNEIRRNLATARMPESSACAPQCGQCEYFNYCNDRF